ncbi:MAG: glycosyltransferase [Actinomycetes bacterium]
MTPASGSAEAPVHSISVVVPVYGGERTLDAVVREVLPLCEVFETPAGHLAAVSEILLVHDRGPDASDEVIRRLAGELTVVRPVWLSRNFGQHAATLAGMASSGGDWVVTMDEDGQHDPAFVPAMLDVAMAGRADVVYARPTTPAPHGWFRNVTSRLSKRVIDLLVGGRTAADFHSYRLVLGELARSVAAYAGAGVYLDVALSWVAGTVATCPVELRAEGERRSGYSTRTLLSHFWRMVLTSGTRLLRYVSIVGAVFAVVGLLVALVLVVTRVLGLVVIPGWTSTMVVVLLSTGVILFALGVVAEYLGVAVNMAMGKPLYLIVQDPTTGPLGRLPARRQADRASR